VTTADSLPKARFHFVRFPNKVTVKNWFTRSTKTNQSMSFEPKPETRRNSP
jgi:hypothetical protein